MNNNNTICTNESNWVQQCFQGLCRLEDRAVLPGSHREKELKMQAKNAYLKMISQNNKQIDM